MRKYLTIFLAVLLTVSFLSPVESQDEIEYRLNNNDLITISVYEEPDLNKTVRVDTNGTISYPLLGIIKAQGLTAKELEAEITRLLMEDYLVSPQVSVFINEYSKVSILGEVKKPGAYELKAGLTILDAIALAGGFTEKSNAKDVKLIRSKGSVKETIKIDANAIVTQGDREQNLRLQSGDLVIVGELSASAFIVVLGQVRSPGRYSFKEGMTVIEAIGLAGGLTNIAASNSTRVIRLKDGNKLNIRVPVGSILSGGQKDKDIILQPEDTIVVPESFF